MTLFGRAGLVVGAMVVVQAASGQVIETPPGISVFPFAGRAAGYEWLPAPEFGFIDAPGGAFGGDMFLATEHFADVTRTDPTGETFPYTVPFGWFPGGVMGLDKDGPLASRPGRTMEFYGGPSMMTIAAHTMDWQPALFRVFPGGRWEEIMPLPVSRFAQMGQLLIDRNFSGWSPYTGLMYVATGEGIVAVDWYFSWAYLWSPLLVQHFTIDVSDPPTGFGHLMWATRYTGEVFAIGPAGQAQPPLAVLEHGTAGLAFGPGDYFGTGLYVCNKYSGEINVIAPDGTVMPFARGLNFPTYPMFVTEGPFAKNGRPTLYVLCLNDVWMFLHCPGDVDDDSKVDFADYLMFLTLFDLMDPRADLNRDDQVDFCDYLVFLNAYGAGC